MYLSRVLYVTDTTDVTLERASVPTTHRDDANARARTDGRADERTTPTLAFD